MKLSPSRLGGLAPALVLLLAACLPDSRFSVGVGVPPCDPSDPEVRILSSATDLEALNDPTARVFCLEPGDYRAYGTVRLEMSGAEGAERHLRYYDPDEPRRVLHPLDQAPEQRALLSRLVLFEADHWVVQGLTLEADSVNHGSRLLGSSHNVLSALLIQGGEGPLLGIQESHARVSRENVIQRSVIRRAEITPRDNNCISLRAPVSGRTMPGNRIVDNEIYDCTDAIQVVARGEEKTGPVPGTVIAHNDLYITPARYADAEGNLDPEGDWACAEEILDLKQGGTAADPLRIIGNRMWGMQRASPACGEQGGWGTTVSQKVHSSHVFYEGNILIGGPRGFFLGAGGHTVLLRNVVHGIEDTTDARPRALLPRSEGNRFYFNTLTDVDEAWLSESAEWYYDPSYFRCNVLANAEGTSSRTSVSFEGDYNAFYDSDPIPYRSYEHDVIGTVAASGLTERCFWRKRFTGPEQFCIPHATTTASSPHAGSCEQGGEAELRCEAHNGGATDVSCSQAGASPASCRGVGTGRCKAYPADWLD